MLNGPLAPWPRFDEDEIAEVVRVLQSNRVNYWTGDEGRAFEREFADWAGVPYAIALANGSVAIELALRALGIGPGDEVVVTPRSFIASASSVPLVGAVPVFADVDPNTQGLSAATIEAVLGPRTRAIICVHLGGHPCDMGPIMELAERRGLYVIEDCAQAHGARYRGRSVGAIGHVGTWSFCQDKIISTGGEGGMVTTSDRDLWATMWAFKDHGKDWESLQKPPQAPGFRWLHHTLGTNYRMTEMQAAIGRVQLRKLAGWTERRNQIAMRLAAVCQEFESVKVPEVPEDHVHAYYRFYAVLPAVMPSGWNRDRFVAAVVAGGAPCFQGSCPEIYLERAWNGSAARPIRPLSNAVELGRRVFCMLVHPTMSEDDISRSELALRNALAALAAEKGR